MTLKIAVQMDPMESVNIAGDSSFALMLSAQKRGHQIFHYDVKGLTLHANGRLTTPAHPVTVQPVKGDHFTFGDPVKLDLGSDVDVVLMRQDPPFHVGYITATICSSGSRARLWWSTIPSRSATRRKKSMCWITRSSCRRP